ncbi:MAG: translocation/assembly module TamB domain-containing protein [Pseudomonadota bacterium]
MTDERIPDMPEAPEGERVERVVERRALWTRIVKWTAIAVGGLVALLGAMVLGLNTDFGRAFVARQISKTVLESGLNLQIGKIEGSLYGAMVLRDVRVLDPKGSFARAKQIRLDWRPFAYLANRIDVRELASPEIQWSRLPELKPTKRDPDAPLLPDIDIDIRRIDVARIDIAQAVTGRRHLARLAGHAHIANGRAEIVADGATVAAKGVAGGDRLALRLDAVPDQDKLDVDLRLNAPADGLVAGLAGLEAPLTFSVEGDGSWKAWNGRAIATLGGVELADLALTARDGRFGARGPTQPGLILKGPVERLAQPQLDVALQAVWKDRSADTDLTLRSGAFQLTAKGLVDLANNRFGKLRLDAMLLKPGAIAPDLNGDSVRAQVELDGKFATPAVDYRVQAAALGFGDTVVRGLYAEGKARVDADRILVPIHARAKQVTGLNAAAGGLLTNLTLDGDLAVTGAQILSDNLKIRSDRVDATAVVTADLAKGRYTGALKGRVNDYQIDGVGVVNVTTDAELYPAPGGGWGIRGLVAGQTQKIFSDGARNFLGGNAVASVRVGLGPDGVITFKDMKVGAPKFRLRDGQGRYDPKGPIALTANGYSTDYGALGLRVSGTLMALELDLTAPRPGLGVGLANLRATVRGRNGAYAVAARGDTDYGPFTADVMVGTGDATTVDVRKARFAGMDFAGRLRQTPAGPFAGQLDFAGSGIHGGAVLAAQGKVQAADVTARAANAKIPGDAQIQIGRATATAKLVLGDPMQLVADVQVANLTMGGDESDFVLRAARAKVDYQGGQGRAQMFARGSSGVPFEVGMQARLAPELWQVALKGQANGVKFGTPAVGRIEIRDGNYRLLPTELSFDKGTAHVAGTYGAGLTFQTRLDNLDLSIVNAFVPDLGIGGRATGSLDFAQATPTAFPTGEARLEIADFTRSSLSAVSPPVQISLIGKLLPDGGDARAIVKRGTTTIGRAIVTLRPLGPGAGSWRERLLAAPLSGGIRYNGPSAVLFSMVGMPGQHVSGPVGIAADFSNRVRDPRLTGVVRASNLTYTNATYGTRLTGMKIEGSFSNDQFVLDAMTAKAGDGTVTATGQVGLSADAGFPVKVRAEFKNARLARSNSLAAAANGWVEVTNNADFALVKGRIVLPEARYEIVRQGAADVPALTGVRRKSGDESDPYRRPDRVARAGHPIRLDLVIDADNKLFLSGMGLESEWGAHITIGGTAAEPKVGGNAQVVQGTYSFAGRRFDLSRQSNIGFQGNALTNPTLNISATTSAEGVTAILNIGGTAQQPSIAFSSTPALPQDEVLARLLFGSSVTDLSATEAIQLAAALNSLRGTGGLNPLGQLRSAAGIDRLRILSADEASGRGTALAAGQYLTDDIYVEVITDARGFTATQLEVALSRALSVLSQTSSFGGSSVSIRYSKDY